MSARGHWPRTSDRPTAAVGGIAHFQWVGVGDYSRSASHDPADIVAFDGMIDEWIGKGFAGLNVAQVAGLRNERKAAR